MTAEILLTVMLAVLTPYKGDAHETIEQRKALWYPVAEAVAKHARDPEEAAAGLADAYHESTLARYVLENRCLEGPPGRRCDNGRSHGAWQVRSWCKYNSVSDQAHCAFRQLRFGYSVCGTGWYGAFAAMRGDGECHSTQAMKRIHTMRLLLEKIRVVMITTPQNSEKGDLQ